MIDRDDPDPADRGRLTEQDLAIAALVGRYIERRERDETPRVHDLLAAAAEFGQTAVDALRSLLACYEAMRAYGEDTADLDPGPSDPRSPSDSPFDIPTKRALPCPNPPLNAPVVSTR
jgi:hypothetical protein